MISGLIVGMAAPVLAATENYWAKPANAAVQVCFKVDTSLPPQAAQQTKINAAEYAKVTANLQTTYANCAAGAHVVKARARNASAEDAYFFQDGAVATTRWETSGADSPIMVNAEIIYDVNAIQTHAQTEQDVVDLWKAFTCHEMGHALGIQHAENNSDDYRSCMKAAVNKLDLHPLAADKAQLNRYYGSAPVNAGTNPVATSPTAKQPTTTKKPTPTVTPKTTVPKQPTATAPVPGVAQQVDDFDAQTQAQNEAWVEQMQKQLANNQTKAKSRVLYFWK